MFHGKGNIRTARGIRETLERRLDKDGKIVLDSIKMTKEDLENINRIYIVACGTAYHAGVPE